MYITQPNDHIVMSGCIHGYVVLGNGSQCHCDCQCQKNVLGDLLLLSLVVLMFEPNLLVNIWMRL